MPRDGLQQYAPPPGTQGVANYTIESARYNTFVADITGDQNNPRPIVAGGTGANNALQAMQNLGGEIAKQLVTNYDAQPWVNGSFYSAAGATSAPNPTNRFAGIYYGNADDSYATVQARDQTTGILYVRNKIAGVWDTAPAWKQQAGSTADLDAAYVNVAGDTMTGALTLNTYNANNLVWGTSAANLWSSLSNDSNGTPSINFFARHGTGTTFSTDAGAGSIIQSDANGGLNFLTLPANSTNVAASGVASLSNAGAFKAVNITANGGTTGTYYFGNSGTKYLQYDGTQFIMNGGQLLHTGDINAWGSLTTGGNSTGGTLLFGNTSTKYLSYDGTNFHFAGATAVIADTGNIQSGGHMLANAYVYAGYATPNTGTYCFGSSGVANLNFDGSYFRLNGAPIIVNNGYVAATGFQTRQGISGSWGSNWFNLYYPGVSLWIDSTNLGNISVTSDYRIKKDVLDLPGMWDTVKALRPIKYTQADFTPPAQLDANKIRRSKYAADVEEAKAKGVEPPPAPEMPPEPMFKADNIERWGFIAHELQDTLVPSASTGIKDSPDHVQSPDPFTVIAALTRALQEAMTRIEALEARTAQPR
jgi:hypothetical protein